MHIRIETSTITDAITNAARLSGVDHYSGVLITASAEHGCTVSACNGALTFRRHLTLQGVEMSFGDTDERQWYVPAKIASRLFAKLPLGEGSMTELSDTDGSSVEIRNGKTKVRMNVFDPTVFPIIPTYDEAQLGEVEGMAKRIKQVAFAVQPKANSPLAGLHITGNHIIGCNGNQLARVHCPVPVTEAVTLPLAPLAGVLKNTDVVLMGYLDNRFVFRTDAETQVTSTVITDPYPNVMQFAALREQWDDATATFNRDEMRSLLERMLALCSEEEYPRIKVRFFEDTIKVGMDVPAVGQMTDELPAKCEPAPAESLTYTMSPKYLLDVLTVWPANEVILEYCSTNVLKPYTVADDELLTMWMGMKD